MERKVKPSQPDLRTIDISDDYALQFWAKEFNVSERKLIAVIAEVGDSAKDIRRELKK